MLFSRRSEQSEPSRFLELGNSILKASFTVQGLRIFIVWDSISSNYRLATRWSWLADYSCHQKAGAEFEKLKRVVWDERMPASLMKLENSQAPR